MANQSPSVDVSTKSLAWQDMSDDWKMTDALRGGTKAMRAAGQTYLPKEPKEEQEKYETRLKRSFLYNAYKDAINSIAGKPFQNAISLSDTKLPEQLEPLYDNADRNGTDLSHFARILFEGGIHRGAHLVLVDYPETNGTPTLAEQRSGDIRPYFVDVDLSDLYGFRTIRDAGGAIRLARVQIHQNITVDEGSWGETTAERIKVWYAPGIKPENFPGTNKALGHWELYENVSGEWRYVRGSEHTYPGIPLVPFYTRRTGYLKACPAMIDLAWKNIEHWQSSSDQRNILRFIRFAMLAGTGLTQEDMDREYAVGPTFMLKSMNKDAKFEFVEHTGAAAEAGRKDLEDIEAQMEVLGVQPLIERSGNQTATGKVVDEGKKWATAQLWVRAEENALRACYETAGRWIDAAFKLPEDFKLDIFSDFALSANTGRDIEHLLKSRLAKQIDHETYLKEIRRRGVIHEASDITEIMDRTMEEQATMSELYREADPDAGDGGDAPPPE